ncbi:hypothetical protein SISNIDRAFT_211143 [Sistotremastrum niveocremeum HHB9708]|uniref:Uncharacterized protein n=1 Tax=Sistotremastrum niveocremeum HHB9708 TaxID=1314777 RepID=A0A164R204_9AGAM|nr:hypothetical protein SISNIDRAFT_211143 [Sistotremastrum niveocremeum HHB9708]
MYRYPSVPTTSNTLIINHYYPEQTGYPAGTSVQEERYGRGDTNLGTNYGANNLGDNNRTNIRHDSHDIDNSDNSSNVDNSERIKNIENWRDGARTYNSKQVYISKHKHSGDIVTTDTRAIVKSVNRTDAQIILARHSVG